MQGGTLKRQLIFDKTTVFSCCFISSLTFLFLILLRRKRNLVLYCNRKYLYIYYRRYVIKTLSKIASKFLFTSLRCKLFYKLQFPLETCVASSLCCEIVQKVKSEIDISSLTFYWRLICACFQKSIRNI